MKKYTFALLLLISSSYSAVIANDTEGESLIGQFIKTIFASNIWNLDTPGVPGPSSPFEGLGEALSHGDYDGDGYQDLAIGIPFYDLNFIVTVNNIGAVLILYGTANGLGSNNSQLLFQNLDLIEDRNGAEAGDLFGRSLASGDFNCDGITDLAVGAPSEDYLSVGGNNIINVGAINVFYGSNTGFVDNGQGSQFLFQGTGTGSLFFTHVSAHDKFGHSLAAGNFDRDSENGKQCFDLAVSAPDENFGNDDQIVNAGVVNIFYGSSSGISGNNRDTLSQDTAGAAGQAESGDRFGTSLASGLFRSASVYSDLAVGIRGQSINGQSTAGAVQIFYGASAGLQANAASSDIFSQSGPILGIPETGDKFGSTLTTGYFNNDFAEDLVVGTPRESVTNIDNAGAIHVIYGGVNGLSAVGNQIFHQNTPGILGVASAEDQFGDALTAGDLNNDGIEDLIVGVPRDLLSSGVFHVIYGSSSGLTTAANEYESNLIGGDFEDRMGASLVVADFGNGNELAVGIPGDNADAGLVEVFVFNDIIFADSFED